MEKIDDHAVLKQVRHQARWVTLKAFLIASLLTLIALVLPQW